VVSAGRAAIRVLALLAAAGLAGCRGPAERAVAPASGFFAEVTAEVGLPVAPTRPAPPVHFMPDSLSGGGAFLDYDQDGDLDIAMNVNNGPAVLLRNDGGNAGVWLRVKLAGRKSNRDGVGAVVRLKSGAVTARRTARAASSYASQSESILTFGLGVPSGAAAPTADVSVTWPGGATQTFPGLAAGRLHVLEEQP